MKKQEVRNLEDEFSTLFKPQHQQSVSQRSDSNLLDSQQPSQQLNSGTFKQLPLNQSQSDDDFLDQIDDLLDHTPPDHQPTRREIMLNFKLNQLRLMCKNLKQANLQLAQRIEELEKSQCDAEVDNTEQLNKSQDLTMMQQDFTELEEELAMYKQQLAKYQHQMEGQLALKDEEIKKGRQEIGELRYAREATQRELRQRGRVISLLQERNEQLLLIIEELEANQQPTIIQSNDNYFNEQISQQMESMIDKLLKELKYEKRTNAKQLSEIKRLNSEVILLENKIKEKNHKIYEIQLAAVKLNKPHYPQYVQYNNSPKGKTSRVNTDRDEQYIGYPQRNFLGVTIQTNKNKTQASFNVNKNRISAEREGAITKPTGYGSFLPLSKVFSTFTLMDLLNKEFKIRTAQKYFIASRIVQLYAQKLSRGDYDNLIPEEIQIYNFNSQNPSQLRVRANALSRSDRYEANEESLLYNMGFVLDSLLNQVQVVDAYLGTILELNIPDYIQLVLGKPSKEEKQKLLIELATSIEREYLND